MTMPSTYIDKELRNIQDSEKQAYMHLRRQISLNPFPDEAATTSTSLPPPIPIRNPARETHYAHSQLDTQDCITPLKVIVSQRQQGQHRPSNAGAVTASDRGEDRDTETFLTNHENAADIKENSNTTTCSLCEAMYSAMDEMGRYPRPRIAIPSLATVANAVYLFILFLLLCQEIYFGGHLSHYRFPKKECHALNMIQDTRHPYPRHIHYAPPLYYFT
ncbi:hypothetical protein J3E69DRAFT_306354 [Trichoderma sp. SZMC 28015]